MEERSDEAISTESYIILLKSLYIIKISFIYNPKTTN